ncbi:MAG: SiaB family protein kinase [Bacteroidales bacterium]|jgi:hypothetical protein|nr:SiaB family protein kinase [Bacteroidales bacterium]
MNSDDVKIFFELLNEDEYCLLYNGNFIDAVTSKIINITKVSLIQRGELIKTQNRFAYLIAECFQNIIRHGGHKEHDVKDGLLPGFFMAKIKNNFYDIVTGNLIDNANIPQLKKIFDNLNGLNGYELKALYNKTLAQGDLSEKGGAGLGLIDMAKKSAQKLEYKFINTSDQKSMFYQRLVITSDTDINERIGLDHNIEFGIKLHKTMIDHNILVLQKSEFLRDSVLPMLKIVEENVIFNQENAKLIKAIYQILIELIQNVNHRDIRLKNRREGIFFISKNESTYSLCSGYYVDNNKIEWLKHFISNVAKMNNEELEKTYLQRLNIGGKEEVHLEEPGSEDLEKIIADRFSFSFYDIDAEASFFSIRANI